MIARDYSEILAKQAASAERKKRRAENAKIQAELAALNGKPPKIAQEQSGASKVAWPDRKPKRPVKARIERRNGHRTAVRKGGRKRRKPSARKSAFLALKKACKEFVFLRAQVLNDGRCEIALACGGLELADTWYHGWPQKGGNGLKYEVLSHFASCSRCNMGEYGARYRGTKEYENRHKEILGEALFNALAARHGRKQISTAEAREMTAKITADTEARRFSREYPAPAADLKTKGE